MWAGTTISAWMSKSAWESLAWTNGTDWRILARAPVVISLSQRWRRVFWAQVSSSPRLNVCTVDWRLVGLVVLICPTMKKMSWCLHRRLHSLFLPPQILWPLNCLPMFPWSIYILPLILRRPILHMRHYSRMTPCLNISSLKIPSVFRAAIQPATSRPIVLAMTSVDLVLGNMAHRVTVLMHSTRLYLHQFHPRHRYPILRTRTMLGEFWCQWCQFHLFILSALRTRKFYRRILLTSCRRWSTGIGNQVIMCGDVMRFLSDFTFISFAVFFFFFFSFPRSSFDLLFSCFISFRDILWDCVYFDDYNEGRNCLIQFYEMVRHVFFFFLFSSFLFPRWAFQAWVGFISNVIPGKRRMRMGGYKVWEILWTVWGTV